MKKQAKLRAAMILSALVMLLGLVMVIGSQTFLSPCIHEDGSFGACHWAGQAMLGVGLLITVLALLSLVLPQARNGLLLAAATTAVLGIAMPGGLIQLCGMDSMRCRAVMQPAMRLLCACSFSLAMVGWRASSRRGGDAA